MLERLKLETRLQHQQIEAELNLLDPDFTLADYIALLRRFYSYYAPWEATVSRAAPDLIAGRFKIPHLIADLRYLEAPQTTNLEAAHCAKLPPLDTRADILGSMYVLEGATLGGQILRKHFSAKFALTDRGCEFFSGYGELTGYMWKQFGETLKAIPANDADATVTSAVATFESMQAWLCRPALKQLVTA